MLWSEYELATPRGTKWKEPKDNCFIYLTGGKASRRPTLKLETTWR